MDLEQAFGRKIRVPTLADRRNGIPVRNPGDKGYWHCSIASTAAAAPSFIFLTLLLQLRDGRARAGVSAAQGAGGCCARIKGVGVLYTRALHCSGEASV